jgi:hypothetical protein
MPAHKHCHGAHAAGLQCAVEREAFEGIGLERGAESAHNDDFRVCGRVVPHLAFVKASAAGCAILEEYRPDLRAAG